MSSRGIKTPWISWGAIFGGLASGMATFILLTMLGLAAGFTAIDPAEAEPVGAVPMITGIWTGISMLVAAFVGGYVAARISGLSRRTDGIFHGFVVWGVSTLLFAYLITTSVGNLMGGVFNILGQGIQATTGAVSSPQAQGSLESLISGSGGGVQITPQALDNLQAQLAAGNRQEATNILVNEMNVDPAAAPQIVEQAMAMRGVMQQLPSGEEAASSAVSGLTTALWWLFAGLALSLALALGGGVLGAHGSGKRRSILAH
ncbi:MAG: hypothetical protein IH614_05525 [Desulfuromonadales bacterium]|nr:hypothetical protein [Desulfuromonadales bacterium]